MSVGSQSPEVVEPHVDRDDRGQRLESLAGPDDERCAHHAARLGDADSNLDAHPAGRLDDRQRPHEPELDDPGGRAGDGAARVDDPVELRPHIALVHAAAPPLHGSASSAERLVRRRSRRCRGRGSGDVAAQDRGLQLGRERGQAVALDQRLGQLEIPERLEQRARVQRRAARPPDDPVGRAGHQEARPGSRRT